MAKISYKFPADKFKTYIEVAKLESVTIITDAGKKNRGPVQMGDIVVATISFRDPAYIGYMERTFAELEKSKQVQQSKKK